MKTTPCPHCGKPISPAAILGAVGGSVTSDKKTKAARANGRAGGGRPVGAKDSKPRKQRQGSVAILLNGGLDIATVHPSLKPETRQALEVMAKHARENAHKIKV